MFFWFTQGFRVSPTGNPFLLHENAFLGRLRRFLDSADKLYIHEIKTPYA